jgi:hypothetical protein
VPVNGVAKWNGSSWDALGGGTDGGVAAFAVFDDGNGLALYAGGSFSTAGGVSARNIARWDGLSWTPLGTGTDSSVASLTVFDDGSGPALFAGGIFTAAGGGPANRVARWDGSSWSALGTGFAGASDHVSVLGVFDDGSGPALHAGGAFTTADGVPANRIARWDGSSWSALGSGTSGRVIALATFDDGGGPALYAGGVFANAYDSGDSYLARWSGCPDSAPPVLSLPGQVVVGDSLSSPPGESVSFSVTASDNMDPSPSVVCTPPSGSFFAPGTTIVNCTATDALGNQSSGQFAVIVHPKIRRR